MWGISIPYIGIIHGVLWVLLSVLTTAQAQSFHEHVTLQLSGRHQFRFAGYYAAVEKGFFLEEGLSVAIRDGKPQALSTDAVLNEDADFAVTDPYVLVQAAQGQPFVLIASVFQHSPLVLVTLKSSQIENVHDLVGRRVMADLDTERHVSDIWAMLAQEGVSLDRVQRVTHSGAIDDLLSGRVDAMAVYAAQDLDRLHRQGLAVNVIRPISYGVDSYGDVLVTHQRLIRQRPQVVDAFVRAVRRGWDYAMRHPMDASDMIIARYDPSADRGQLLREAAALHAILQAEHVDIGHSSPARWRAIATAYARLGVLPQPIVPDGFLFDDFKRQRQKTLDTWRDLTFTVAGTALFVTMLVIMLNSGLRAMVKQRTKALAESEERFRTMADSMPFLIWISGLDRGCTWFNASWLAFTGRKMSQEIGNGWADGVHPDDMQRCMEIYDEHFHKQRPFQMEYRLQRHDGQYRWLLDAGAPRFLDDGTFAGFSGACLDISDRKQAEADLHASRLDLTRSNEALQQFAYAASHDLQEPLRMISSYLQLIDRRYRDRLDESGREFLFFAVDGAQRMQALICELLEFSRLGRQCVERTPVNLQICWDLAVHNLHVAVQESQAQLDVQPLPPTYGCPGQITRLLQNVLSNAIKYRRPQTIPVITVRWRRLETEWLEVTVQDNGIGLDPGQCDSIFGLFVRLHTHQDYPGTGMGLTMCRKIVELHGGSIWASSEGENCGTRIVMTLPPEDPNPG